jgi:hypothetical protein
MENTSKLYGYVGLRDLGGGGNDFTMLIIKKFIVYK